MQRVMTIVGALARWARKLGPYVLLEMLLPGGTLFALLLLFYQNRKAGIGMAATRPTFAMTRALVRNAGQAA